MAVNTKAAGRIVGSPLCGLCERVCISVRKIFDGCMTRYSNENFTLQLTNFTPSTVVPPYTYIMARSTGETTITNLIVTPIDGNRSRVQFTSTVELIATFTDANNVMGTATGTVSFDRDIVLNVPDISITPYTIEATTNILSRIGSINSNGVLNCTLCAIQITRVVVPVDMLVPSYGYCEYPQCENYADTACQGIFELPVFPPFTE